MTKKLFEIVTFPFYLIFLFISFPFKIVKIILDDKLGKEWQKKTSSPKMRQEELLEMGRFLFRDCHADFIEFFSLFLNDREAFIIENEVLLERYDNFELDKLEVIDAVYIFGDSKQKLLLIDWRGEENEREIESFIEDKFQMKTGWPSVNALREGVDNAKQREGKFIISLLMIIDKDLEPFNKRLIFLDLGWDSYVFTVVDQPSYNTLTGKYPVYFYGTEKLTK